MPPMRIDAQRDFGRRECPSCACEGAANHNRCPICGYEFPVAHPARRSLLAIIALLLLALIVLGYLRLAHP